jgi:Tfp pilus assembly protein FimT
LSKLRDKFNKVETNACKGLTPLEIMMVMVMVMVMVAVAHVE